MANKQIRQLIASPTQVLVADGVDPESNLGYYGLSSIGKDLLGAITTSQGQEALSLVPGTDVQVYDSDLSAIAALSTTGAIERTGAGTAATFTVTDSAKQLLDDSSFADMRTTLELGSISTQSASNVAITGGSISGIADLAITDGGTGASTAQGAINALAGAVTSGQYLRGNGTNVVMSAIQAADVPTLNQNTTGTASNVTGVVALANGGTGATTAPNARTNLGLAIGTNVQAYDADLAAIAALTTTGLIDRTGSGTATTRATGATGLAVLASANAAAARTATNTAENLEAIDSWRDGSQVTNWSRFQATLNTIITKNRARGLTSGAMTTPTGTYPGSNAYIGGVLLTDGRVFCVPFSATTARIYDPATDTLTTPAGTYPGSNAYRSGVLLPDGRVFCVPSNDTTARIYDPATDTLTTPTGTYPGSGAYYGGVLLTDGRVFCVPLNATSARIYDPATDTLTTPAGTYPGGGAYVGGVLLPDGRVFCVPYSATTARIYDPATDTLTTPAGTYPGGAAAYHGGVLLTDGRVFCVPHSATSARIYDPVANTLTTPAGTYPGSAAYVGGVLLPDGRVFCVPHSATSARIYDPVTNTLTTPAGTYPGSNAYAGGVLLPDGRVFCVPLNATTARIAATRSHVHLDSNITLSPFFNKF